MKPGIKTTEFWMQMLVQVLNAVLFSLGQIDAHWAITVSGIVAVVYSICRTVQKGLDTPDTVVTEVKNPDTHTEEKTITTTAKAVTAALLLVAMTAFMGGCANTEVVTVREGIVQGYAPIVAEYKTIIADKQAKGELTANDVRIRLNTLQSVDDFVAKSRASDNNSFFTAPAITSPTTFPATRPN